MVRTVVVGYKREVCTHSPIHSSIRGGKIGPTRWANPIRPELGLDLAIKLLVRPNMSRPDMARPCPTLPNFFCLQKAILLDQPDF